MTASTAIVLLRDARTLPREAIARMHAMITDPPYAEAVHRNATSQSPKRGARHRDLGFDHLKRSDISFLASCAVTIQRWSVVYSDVEGSWRLRIAAQTRGAEYVRTIPWVRWSMPQLSGDRPPQGFEHLLLFHPPGAKRWNGSGALTHLQHSCMRGETKHKAEKPLDQALDLVSWFSDPGEIVFDPYAGHATIGRACQLLGRAYVGCEIDPAWQQRATERLARPLDDQERERVRRWLAQPDQASEPEGPAAERMARRRADKSCLTL